MESDVESRSVNALPESVHVSSHPSRTPERPDVHDGRISLDESFSPPSQDVKKSNVIKLSHVRQPHPSFAPTQSTPSHISDNNFLSASRLADDWRSSVSPTSYYSFNGSQPSLRGSHVIQLETDPSPPQAPHLEPALPPDVYLSAFGDVDQGPNSPERSDSTGSHCQRRRELEVSCDVEV